MSPSIGFHGHIKQQPSFKPGQFQQNKKQPRALRRASALAHEIAASAAAAARRLNKSCSRLLPANAAAASNAARASP
jgi:hypothetical protein